MAPDSRFSKHISLAGFFALAFGAIVGSAWVVVLGDWMRAAGPGGAAAAFLIGGTLMLLLVACYAELADRMPQVGADFAYIHNVLGARAGFVAGWFLALNYLVFATFEGIAITRLLSAAFPLERPALYHAFGQPVTVVTLAISVGVGVVLGLLNAFGARAALRLQALVTFSFLGFVMVLVLFGLAFGHAANRQPLFAADTPSTLAGMAWITGTSIIFINGFQAAALAIEERAPDVTSRAVVHAMLAAVLVSAVLYCGIILAAAGAAPWRMTAGAALPAVYAFAHLIPAAPWLGSAVIVLASFSVLKTWNALIVMASRTLFALSSRGLLPAALGRIDRHGIPRNAVLAVMACNVAGATLGSGLLVPILQASAASTSLAFSLLIYALLRLRMRRVPHRGFAVPGGAAMIVVALLASICMGVFATVIPLWQSRDLTGVAILALWGALGWLLTRRSGALNGENA